MPDYGTDVGNGPDSLRYVPVGTVLSPSNTDATTNLVKADAPLRYGREGTSGLGDTGVLCAVNEVPELISTSRCEIPNFPIGVVRVPNAVAGSQPTNGFIYDLPYSGSVPSADDLSILADGLGAFKIVSASVGAAASLTTGIVGNNNAILWSATAPGTAGNSTTIALVDPAGNDQPLVVSVAGSAITVSLATGVAGAITSTAAQVIAAIRAHGTAEDLVTVANASTSTGAGVVVAVAATPLASGTNSSAGGVGRVLKAANGRMRVQF